MSRPTLTGLPPELRTKIFGYCIPPTIEIFIGPALAISPELHRPTLPPNPALPLLTTCKSIYVDLAMIPNTTLTLVCDSSSTFFLLPIFLGYTNISYNKHISAIKVVRRMACSDHAGLSEEMIRRYFLGMPDCFYGLELGSKFGKVVLKDWSWERVTEPKSGGAKWWIDYYIEIEVEDALEQKSM